MKGFSCLVLMPVKGHFSFAVYLVKDSHAFSRRLRALNGLIGIHAEVGAALVSAIWRIYEWDCSFGGIFEGLPQMRGVTSNEDEFRRVKTTLDQHTVPFKMIGTARSIPLLLLYTEGNWVWGHVHEMTDRNFSLNFLIFLSRFVKQLRTYYLLYKTTQFLGEQKYWNMWWWMLKCVLDLFSRE